MYFSASDSLRRAVHAHVWAGGADSWVWAAPMDGSSPGLGLTVTEGELWAYSIESRDNTTSSNVRGHIYLHVTDAGRNADSFGGQPDLVLSPGQEYRLGWRLAWYDDLDQFHADQQPLMLVDKVTAEVGASITVTTDPSATLSTPSPLVCTDPGTHYVDASTPLRRSRIAVFAHPPLRTIVEARMRFVLDSQRPRERSDSRRGALVPFDNDTGLTVLPGSWGDRSDTRERVGTALLLQEARDRGWGRQDELRDALHEYEVFVDDCVVRADGTVQGDSTDRRSPRLYDFPWYARFLLGQQRLDRALSVIDRYYALGGHHFLAFDLGPLLVTMSRQLSADGRLADAERLRGYLSWPSQLSQPDERAKLRQAGEAILESNLTAFRPDGSASCAFVYPSYVDGRSAHIADPLANDQDWALVYALRLTG